MPADALDTLYAAPLDAFVSIRRELATALRKAGDAKGARDVAAAAKPTRTSWALNQVARRRPELLHRAFEARDAAAAAQARGDPARVRATSREFRECVAAAVRAARDVAVESGADLTAAQARRVGETIQAASGGGETRATLLSGRMARDLLVDDPFAGLEEPALPARPPVEMERRAQARSAAPAKKSATEIAREQAAVRAREAHERALGAAREKIASLEGEAREANAAARDAERTAHDAERAAVRARADADRASRTARDVEQRLARAKADLEALRQPGGRSGTKAGAST